MEEITLTLIDTIRPFIICGLLFAIVVLGLVSVFAVVAAFVTTFSDVVGAIRGTKQRTYKESSGHNRTRTL